MKNVIHYNLIDIECIMSTIIALQNILLSNSNTIDYIIYSTNANMYSIMLICDKRFKLQGKGNKWIRYGQ